MIPKHDLHTHTNYSDGNLSPARVLELAEERGVENLAITDHGPELSVGINQGRIGELFEKVNDFKGNLDISVYLGIEANVVNMSGDLDLEQELLKDLDLVIAGVHYVESSESSPKAVAQTYLEKIFNLIESQDFDVLAHPFWYCGNLPSYLSRTDIEIFAELAAENDVAIELNERHEAPSKRVISICKQEGIEFSLGSDAHTYEEVGNTQWCRNMIEEFNISENDLVLNSLLRG